MILGNYSHYKHIIKINLIKVESSDEISLLRITINKKLTFKRDTKNLVKKLL